MTGHARSLSNLVRLAEQMQSYCRFFTLGRKGENAFELAQDLLDHFGDLQSLSLVDVRLLDHVILGDHGRWHLMEQGGQV